MKKVLIISTSMRNHGNSNALANAFMKGALAQGNEVELVSLHDKNINYCIGCLSCQKTGKCVIRDDMSEILTKMKESDVVVFATPIYFYEMSGQMKTLLDRSNPLYNNDYKFRDIYLLASAAEEDTSAMDGAVKGLSGWIECFDKAQLKGIVYGVGLTDQNDAGKHPDVLEKAEEMGKHIHS